MKIWKLVSGILSITFFAFVVLQSCAAGTAFEIALKRAVFCCLV